MIRLLSKIFFWTYPRGCWQYDLICLAILAFIFLTPPSIWDGSAFNQPDRDDRSSEERQARIGEPQPHPRARGSQRTPQTDEAPSL